MNKKRWLVLVGFTALAFFIYRDSFDVFIPGDNYSFLYMFRKDGFASILNNAREGAPYFVAYPLLFLLYKLIGLSSVGWVILSVSLHSLNAFLVYLIASRLLKACSFRHLQEVSIFSALLFLISPYQTEHLLWVSISIRWLFHAGATLWGIYELLRWMEKPSGLRLSGIHFLFLLGMFSYELTMMLPVISAVLFWLYKKYSISSIGPRTFITKLILPQVGMILLYFVVCKLVSGHWLWHAGTVSDITQSSDPLKTFLKYLAKFFLLYRYLPLDEMDGALRSLFNNYLFVILTIAASLVLSALAYWRAVKANIPGLLLLPVLFLCFVTLLLPVLPLDSSFLKYIYPDRYGYLPSVFFYIFLALLLFAVLKKAALPVLTGYAVLSGLLLLRTIPVWKASNDHCHELIKDFQQFSKYDRVYVLNAPTYFKGVAAFRSALAESMFMLNDLPVENIRVISGYYLESDADTLVSVNWAGNLLTVTGPQKNTPYFSIEGGWARSYETKEYNVAYDETGCVYTLSFKEEIPANSAVIYEANGKWRKAFEKAQ